MKKNKKLIFIFLLILGFMVLISGKVSAFTVDGINFDDFIIQDLDTSVNLDDFYYIVYYYPGSSYGFKAVRKNISSFYVSANTDSYFSLKSTPFVARDYFYDCSFSTDGSIREGPYAFSQSQGNERNVFIEEPKSNISIVYSNFDIKDSEGNVVFPAPPQQGEEAQVILAPVVAQVEMSQTLSEIVKLLPLIIAVVVSFLGLRKALQMLFRVLRTS